MPIRSLIALPLLLLTTFAHATAVIDHKIEVTLDPVSGRLEATDQITLPAPGSWQFTLHAGLNPSIAGNGKLERRHWQQLAVPVEHFRLTTSAGERRLTLRYQGIIRHPLQSLTESPGRERQLSAGTIDSKGVFLSAASAWFPLFDESLQRFELKINLPESWLAVSQGSGPDLKQSAGRTISHWRVDQPQDDIYLIAAPFHLNRQQDTDTDLQVYLRTDDSALARRYLDVTQGYIDLYQRLIGPYPYPKFAMVENFWETGYGMPSFTLLGSRVIRLPFILYTSYPHEILHNWWGNGVYPDYSSGNWSEGLTSYLADHLLKEQKGEGEAYRRDALQRYQEFVRSENDFPLTAFRSRHSSASQAIGYGKSLMLFHMLRKELGDTTFINGLRRFYRDNRFKLAGYEALRTAFEQVSGRQLTSFFDQWTQRTGAPALLLEDVRLTREDSPYRLSARLRQTQPGKPFQLRVPVTVHFAGAHAPLQTTLSMDGKEQPLELELAAEPVRLDIDPHFDLFRQLHPEEAPASLGKLYGAKQALIILPSRAPDDRKQAYLSLAKKWAAGYLDATIRFDDELKHLPTDQPLWLLGWDNRFLDEISSQWQFGQLQLSDTNLSAGEERYDRNRHSVVIANQNRLGQPQAWIGADDPGAIIGLIRKLPHYNKYGLLVFEGKSPTNRIKRQWQIERSPLRITLTDQIINIQEKPSPSLLSTLPPVTP